MNDDEVEEHELVGLERRKIIGIFKPHKLTNGFHSNKWFKEVMTAVPRDLNQNLFFNFLPYSN